MSVIFGVRKTLGEVVKEEELLRMAARTERYSPEGTFVYAGDGIGMGFQPYHTTDRSRIEAQPVVDDDGNLLVLDGRLDNYQDLRRELQVDQSSVADSKLILAAFLHWGEECFSRFVGDWAIALWSATDRILYLARDHAGTRTLYFQDRGGNLCWSTFLEQFLAIRSAEKIDGEYAACYLGSLPIADLTPYLGVRAVPPAHYLVIEDGHVRTKPHWQWMTRRRVRYKTDEDYENYFLSLFRTAVERRTVPGAPILAHLSGGMDSTSIVCMSDHINRSKDPSLELLDTLSLYDDSEPHWNEMPYFSITEARRGKVGIHIKMSYADRTFEPLNPARGIHLFPGADSASIDREKQFQQCLEHRAYRVILSGMGGDELLGGVPTPLPELADYLVTGDLKLLLTQTIAWCVANRTVAWHELFNAAKFVIDLYRWPRVDRKTLPPWISPHLRRLCVERGQQSVAGRGHFGLLPSAVSNGQTWWITLETLPHLVPSFWNRFEYRYPYLDRDMVDFLFAIPREQLVRPGRRRSLMRRALKGIVPSEILERRRKAYLIRGPLALLQANKRQIETMFADSCAVQHGFIDRDAFYSALQLTVEGVDHRWRRALMNTIAFELWLRAKNGLRAAAVENLKPNEFMLQQGRAEKLPAGQIAS